MKKILLGTTALVATGLTAGAANAAALKVDVNGYYTGVAGMVDTGGSFRVTTAPTATPSSVSVTSSGTVFGTSPDDVVVKQEGEISFNGSVTLDNGMTAGVEVNLEATNGAGGTIDESYAYLEGSFGRIQIGAEGSAPFLMHFSAPYFVGSHGVDSPNFSYDPASASRTTTYITLSGDNNKVTYFTPRFSGIQLGISYTPDNLGNLDTGGQAGGTSNAFGNTLGASSGNLEDIIEVGANYTGTFKEVGVGASIGYATAENEVSGFKDPEVWSFGLQLTSGAFTLGGGYYMSDDLVAAIPSGAPIELEEKAYSVALQYATGPWTVGAGYLKSETEGSISAAPAIVGSGEAQYEVIEVGATYSLGEGVDVFAVAEFYRNEVGANAVDGSKIINVQGNNDTDAVGVGIDLAF